MRWLILTDDHPPMLGGIASFVRRVAAGLVERGHIVTVASRSGRTPIPGTRWIGARGPSFGRYAGRWLGLAAGRELLGADRVLATTWVAGTLASRVRDDVVVTAHGSDVTRPPIRSASTFRRVWGRAGRRLALSEHLVRALADRGVVARPLPAPVPIDETAPPERARRGRWGFVGRLTLLKGADRFVRWVARAGARGVVVGDGPEGPGLQALARSLDADVAFVGPKTPDQLHALWPELDLVVLAPRAHADGSGAEGLGLVLLEAAGRGVPAVGCATGGVPEAVGPTGLVLSDPDDIDGSVAAIRAWWTPRRGAEAWSGVRERHGLARTLAALEGEP